MVDLFLDWISYLNYNVFRNFMPNPTACNDNTEVDWIRMQAH